MGERKNGQREEIGLIIEDLPHTTRLQIHNFKISYISVYLANSVYFSIERKKFHVMST